MRRRTLSRAPGIGPYTAPHAEVNSPSIRRYESVFGIAQPRRIFSDDIEHRLNIRRRAGNHAQDFTRRGLLLQRFLEFLNSRTFSMAITAWSAKVSSSLICAGVKGRTSVRRAPSVPMNSPC